MSEDYAIKTASGVTIPFPERIKEEFQIHGNGIVFNVSFEKLGPMLWEFLKKLREPLFFVLEIPLTQDEEVKIRKSDTDPLHRKVCYLDGQTKEQIKDILRRYGDLLTNDGISQFAVASHATNDEMYVQKYKVVSILSDNPEKYVDFLRSYGLRRTDGLVTPWDTFTHEAPGQSRRVEVNGIDVFDVYNELVKAGLYDAKVVED